MEEKKKSICKNPWCKVWFIYETEEAPDQCPKCIGFESMSGGITWSDKKYEGSRFDGYAHPTSINVQKAGEKKKSW